MHQPTKVFPSVPVTFTGQPLVSHAGARILTSFIDALGFDARRRRRARLGPGRPALRARRVRQRALERNRLPVLRTHREEPGRFAYRNKAYVAMQKLIDELGPAPIN
ncbi:hypothetical protein [Arthrobacter sp. UYCu712]|uniref:hypothetical protein n=1 Tax=Arthrobacter sp. UYCu712 TaxID=3156340 RepID=UPI0033995291